MLDSFTFLDIVPVDIILLLDVELVRTIFDISKELNDFDHSNYKGIVLGLGLPNV